ncbi:parathyroid hormone 4 isoform X1 [Labeo rohita]|nr:parathyroid hormone 4 isoform X1 [Labeo rohita]
MMLKTQRSQQRVALMILMVVAAVQCQENESRRAVTEHQLMHDRGRSIQSLKRLIWLSSAIEGLHTAQTRTLTAEEPDSRWRSRDAAQLYSQLGKDSGSSSHKRALETLLSDMYRPHLTSALGDGEK